MRSAFANSLRSLRAYAFDLLHFARWWNQRLLPLPLSEIEEATLLDYVRYQLDQEPPPAPATVNRRLTVVHCLYRFHYGREIAPGQTHFQRTYTQRAPLGYGRPRRAMVRGLRLRQAQRVVVPLSAEEVAKFWRSFRTFRDLALVGLMLLDGLRSCEVLALQLADLQLADLQMRVRGKGNKQRIMPLPEEIRGVLEKYLHLERPLTNSPSLFVCLKGRHRGLPLTPAGLRTLFRHHRLATQIPQANPHRFRHTFGADMVRDGISLPALQHLMGHADPHHHALRSTSPPGCLAPIPPRHRNADQVGLFAKLMPPSTPSLEQIFQAHIQTLALTLRPDTVSGYGGATRRFLSYLRTAFPRVRRLSQLRRDPHLLGWFRSLCEQQPPLSNKTRTNLLLCLRRLLEDLSASGHSLSSDLIRCEDFPPPPHYLPRPLSPQDDQLPQQELRRTGDLPALALLLTRATGIRIGECIASASASIWGWTACGKSGRTNGRCMSPSANCTPNV